MKLHNLRRASGIAAVVVTMGAGLAACGSDSSSSTADDSTGSTPTTSAAAPTSAATSGGTTDAGAQFGAGCKLIPTSGKGSFNGMASDPVATAASNNPLLSTLVSAVGVAGLGDTLNSLPAATVFAPDNDAFAAIPKKALMAVLADKTQLTTILTHHVLPVRLDPTKVVGDQTTVAGDTVTVSGDTSGMKIAGTLVGGDANVVCGNIQTANATVYVIDAVLKPGA